jgi:hypothetical protein
MSDKVEIDSEKIKEMLQARFGSLEAFYEKLKNPAGFILGNNESKKLQKWFGGGASKRSFESSFHEGRMSPHVLERLAEVLRCSPESLMAKGKVYWSIPRRQWSNNLVPGALLRPEYRVIPFLEDYRKGEIQYLDNWREDARPVAVRLMTGDGGMGKTRLALEYCLKVEKAKWRSGFLEYGSFRQDEKRWRDLLADPRGLLLVFDYAEHHLDELSWLLNFVFEHPPEAKLRLLLLARDAGDWFSYLRASRGAGELLSKSTSYNPVLPPLAATRQDRRAFWEVAAEKFSQKLGLKVPAKPAIDLDNPVFDRILFVLMDALMAAESGSAKEPEAILDHILAREQRFWSESLKARELPQNLLAGLNQFMAYVTLARGVATCDEAMRLLCKFRIFAGQPNAVLNSINQLLHECYPGEPGEDGGDLWIGTVQPDLLGEHLINVACDNVAFGDEVRRMIEDLGEMSGENDEDEKDDGDSEESP